MFSGTFGRKAQHSHFRIFNTGNGFGSLCRTNSNLCQLVRVRNRSYGNVTHHQNTILTILGSMSQE